MTYRRKGVATQVLVESLAESIKAHAMERVSRSEGTSTRPSVSGQRDLAVTVHRSNSGDKMSALSTDELARVERKLQALGKEGKAHKRKDGKYNFPIVDRRDLLDAILAIGRGAPGERFSVKRWIVYRARLLGMKTDVPNTWIAEVGEAVTA